MKNLLYIISVSGIMAALWFTTTGYSKPEISLQISQIQVQGQHRVGSEEILARAGLRKGNNLLALSLDQAAKRILDLAWIKDVSISRVFPDRVVIQVEEYQPAARIQLGDGVWGLVEEGGKVIPVSPEELAREAPGLFEIHYEGPLPPLEALQGAVALIRTLQTDPRLLPAVNGILFRPGRGYWFTLGFETPLWIRFGFDNYPQKLAHLQKILSKFRPDPRVWEEIDLDYPDRALARPRPTLEEQSGGGQG
jgi:cell division septal protein FtsQ